MAQKRNRPAGNRAASKQVDETTISLAPTSGLARYPAVHASICPPCGARRRWAGYYRHDECGGGTHLIFGGTQDDLVGVRMSGCRRGRVWVVAARVYEVTAVADVAA